MVSAAGAGSSLWVDPGAANLRLVAALPLLLSLVHDLVDFPSRKPLLLGCALLVLHAMGKPVAVALEAPFLEGAGEEFAHALGGQNLDDLEVGADGVLGLDDAVDALANADAVGTAHVILTGWVPVFSGAGAAGHV